MPGRDIGGLELWCHAFSTSVLGVGEQSASHPGQYTLLKVNSTTEKLYASMASL
jgi:hypothetical protein